MRDTSSSLNAVHVPLPHVAVALHRNACLKLRSRYAECGYCEQNCPTAALTVAGDHLSVAETCTGCGRCVAACPTGALRVEGFSLPANLDAKGKAPVSVDCWKAPNGAEVRVPCLGGLSMSQLLELRLVAGPREIRLLDRGWCAACLSGEGAKEHPAAKSLKRTEARLRDAGLPEWLWPRLHAAPTDRSRMREGGPQLARRRFLRRLAAAGGPAAGPERFSPAPAPDRERVLETLSNLAALYGGEVSAKLFHRVDVNDKCRAHGVCAAGCPTGALRIDPGAHGPGLSHSSELCIGCGHCERVCPEHAVHVQYGAGRAASTQVAKFSTSACITCGTVITTGLHQSARNLCDACEKSRALARAAFNEIYSHPRGRASHETI
jgi:ferredoxin